MDTRTRGMPRPAVALVLVLATTQMTSACAASKEEVVSSTNAREALVATVEETAGVLEVTGWNWDGAPEVGNCGARRGERVDWTYGYGAPPPDGDHGADAQRVADFWRSLGMDVRIVESPVPAVYGTGGPVRGLTFITAPGDYYIAGTSLCVPGDADEIRKQDNG